MLHYITKVPARRVARKRHNHRYDMLELRLEAELVWCLGPDPPMRAVEEKTDLRSMPFAVRPMRAEDVRQAVQVERDAFPSHFPQTAFRRELNNGLASYWVAWRPDYDNDAASSDSGLGDGHRNGFLVGKLFRGVRTVWTREYDGGDRIAGFLGTWYMADEAHIVSVAVRKEHRSLGIGELLLIGAIEHAIARHASKVTLEVRVSNMVARNLYKKYDFSLAGVRRGYYADDREDAAIMSTGALDDPTFTEHFESLKLDHAGRWGYSERLLG